MGETCRNPLRQCFRIQKKKKNKEMERKGAGHLCNGEWGGRQLDTKGLRREGQLPFI